MSTDDDIARVFAFDPHDSPPLPPEQRIADEPPPEDDGEGAKPGSDLQDDLREGMHHGQLRMAYRLVNSSHRDKLMHVHGLGWHRWDGRRWTPDDQGHAMRAVRHVLREALQASLDLDGNAAKAIRRDVDKCSSAAGMRGVLALATSMAPYAATVRDLDADPYLLNVANGTLDLRTLELRGHRPADRITKVTTAAYDTGSAGPTWAKFLERVVPDPEVRGFLCRLVGVGLLGLVVEHVLGIATGSGMNGKSVFYKAIDYAMGDYASIAEPDLFMHREGAHPTGEMDLLGKRWVVVSESDEGRRLAEATMKRLTGGDPITARRMRQDFVTFDPSHTPMLITNHLPKVRGDDLAIWRRLRVIPFDVVIPEAERDAHLSETLRLDADAILTWAVTGYADYTRRGHLDEPQQVLAATDAFRLSSDAVARFIDECCYRSSQANAKTGELYAKWCAWARDDGTDPGSSKALGQALDRHGYPADPSRRRNRYGLGLLANQDDEGGDQ